MWAGRPSIASKSTPRFTTPTAAIRRSTSGSRPCGMATPLPTPVLASASRSSKTRVIACASSLASFRTKSAASASSAPRLSSAWSPTFTRSTARMSERRTSRFLRAAGTRGGFDRRPATTERRLWMCVSSGARDRSALTAQLGDATRLAHAIVGLVLRVAHLTLHLVDHEIEGCVHVLRFDRTGVALAVGSDRELHDMEMTLHREDHVRLERHTHVLLQPRDLLPRVVLDRLGRLDIAEREV